MFKLLTKTLSSALAEKLSAVSIPCHRAFVQAARNNSGVVMLGDSTVTSTNGIELTKPQTNTQNPWLPLESRGGNAFDLDGIYVIGTQADVVNVLYEVY